MKAEDFDAWLREPVTKYIFAAVRKAAEREKTEWMRRSWEGGECEPLALVELKTRAFALTELVDNDFETWKSWSEDGLDSED